MLLPAAAACWAATGWAVAEPAGTVLVVAVVTGVLAAVGTGIVITVPARARAISGHATTALLVATCAATAVLLVTAVDQYRRSAGPLRRWAADRAVIEARAHVLDDPHRLSGSSPGRVPIADRYVVRLRLDRITGRGTTVATQAPALVIGDPKWAGLSAGQRVTVIGRLTALPLGDDVATMIVAQGAPRAVSDGVWIWRVADRLRAGLRRACSGLPADGGGLLPSLVVGDTALLPDRLKADLQTAGLTHITAVSGANVAIILASVMWLARVIGVPRRSRLIGAGAALAAFVVLARPEPSVLRAAAMGGLGLLGLLNARRPRGVPMLSTAVIVVLTCDPWLSRSFGFALSCAATAALLLLAPLWAARLRNRLPGPVALAVSVPAAAQTVCGPLLILLQPSLGLIAVPANLLAEPAVAPATVLGVVAALLGPLWPSGAHVAAWAGGWATGWVAVVAHTAAGAPGARLPWPDGVPGATVLALMTAGLIAVTVWPSDRRATARPSTRSPTRQPTGQPTRSPTRSPTRCGSRALVVIVAGTAVLVLAWVVAPRIPAPGAPRWPGPLWAARWPPSGWAVVQCDVGQGDAMVLRSGPDRAVLVDAGPVPDRVDGCLRRLGIHRLDLVVLTHHHADHVLGLPGALHGRAVALILVSPLVEPAENATAARRWAADAGVPVAVGWAGMSGATGGAADGWQVRWRLLAPRDPPQPPSAGEGGDGTAVNESSLVTEFDDGTPSGPLRVIALGDLETDGQQRLAGRMDAGLDAPAGPVDVVKVAHHGSARQSEALYRLLDARGALMGVGTGNDYGHPAPSALTMLRAAGAAVFRTDLDGDVAVVPSGGGVLRVAERGDPSGRP
jgi:competence protein ComEC